MIRTARPASVFSVIAGFRCLRADRRANVLMIFAFALMPMTMAVGMTIDYARAARLQTKLNAVADAAALTAVSKPQMSQTALARSDRAEVKQLARSIIKAQKAELDAFKALVCSQNPTEEVCRPKN